MSTTRRSPKRRPARKRSTRARSSRGRGKGRGRPSAGLLGRLPHWPALDQSQRDVAGLALAAVGVFMGVVIYGRWDGGRIGHGLAGAVGWCVGEARVLAPMALVAGGAALLLAGVMPARRPL